MSKIRTYEELCKENEALRILLQDTHEVVGSALERIMAVLMESLSANVKLAEEPDPPLKELQSYDSYNPWGPLDDTAILPPMFTIKVGEA